MLPPISRSKRAPPIDPNVEAESPYAKVFPRNDCRKVFRSVFTMRHAIALLFPGHPEAMTRFNCRFTFPVLLGVRLRTIVWKTTEHSNG